MAALKIAVPPAPTFVSRMPVQKKFVSLVKLLDDFEKDIVRFSGEIT